MQVKNVTPAKMQAQPHSVAQRHNALLDQGSWAIMKDQASVLVASGMLPSTVKTPQAAVAIMMKGIELDIPPMQAFSHINIIQGKPTISAELMLSLIYRKYPNAEIDFVRVDGTGCEIMAARPGRKQIKISFTEEDAKAAQLNSKENWKKYARAMYRSRAVAEMARTVFPDAIAGCSYTPEELDQRYDHEGNFIDVKPERQPVRIEADLVEAPKAPAVYSKDDPKVVARLEAELAKTDMLYLKETVLTILDGQPMAAGAMSKAIEQAQILEEHGV